nr:TIR domain-containing protein [Pseudofrankia sp. BMG5.36]
MSHASGDAGWAEWIGWQLEKAGFRVRVQAWEMVPGARRISVVQDSIRMAVRTIIVVSAEYLASAVAQAEWGILFGEDPAGEKRNLVPVKIEDCQLSGLLAGLVSFDLFGLGEERAREVLLDRIRVAVAGTARPSGPPGFPGGPAPAFPSPVGDPEASLPRRVVPPYDQLPEVPASYVSRPDDLARIRELLLDEASTPVVGLLGNVGSGKTLLATVVVHDPEVRMAFPDGIAWPGHRRNDFDGSSLSDAIGHILNIFGDLEHVEDVKKGLARLERLLSDAAFLIILDGWTWSAGVELLLPMIPRTSRVLFISARDDALPDGFTAYKLSPVSPGQEGEVGVRNRLSAVRRRLANGISSDNVMAVRTELAEILSGLEGDVREQLEAEFGFVLDDEVREVLSADMNRCQWVVGVWAALAEGNDPSFADPEPQPSTNEPAEQIVHVDTIVIQGLIGPAGRSVGECLLDVLRLVFALPPTLDKALRTSLAAEKTLTQEIRFDCAVVDAESVACHVEICDVPLTTREVAGRLAEREGEAFDQFVIISPLSDPTPELDERLTAWQTAGRYPFDVQIWSPRGGVGGLLALDPDVYAAVYGEDAYAGESAPRGEVAAAWRTRLTKPVRYPDSLRAYLSDDDLHCLSGEDRSRFRDLLNEFVEPWAADDRGTPLGTTLEVEIQSWLADPRPESGSLLLLAEFGEGKSFFTYQLSRSLARDALRDPRGGWIPLRIALKDLRNVRDGRDLLERRLADIDVTVAQWNAASDRHQTLVILDGFDEMSVRLDPASLRSNIALLATCHEVFHRSKLLITSRTQFFERQRDQDRFLDRVGRPRILRLVPAARDKVTSHLRTFARRVDAEAKLDRLLTLYDPVGLARKPLFLEMIKETLPDLPDDHFDELVLYRKYVERSLRRKIWGLADDSLEVKDDETVANVQTVLEKMAAELFLNGKTHIELRSWGDHELAATLWRMSDGPVASLGAEAVDDARARIGIRSLLKPFQGVDLDRWPVDFFHRSMREYFFACAIFGALRHGDARPLLIAAPLRSEVMDFVTLMIGDGELAESERDQVIQRLLGLARSAVRGSGPGSLGGNALSLLAAARPVLPPGSWSGLDLDYAHLAGADLSGLDFSNSSLRYANLDNADLREIDLRNADLTGVRLEETARVLALSRPVVADDDAVYAYYSDNKIRRWPLAPRDRSGPDTVFADLPRDLQGVAVSPFGDLVLLASGRLEIHLWTGAGFVRASRGRPDPHLHGLRDIDGDLVLTVLPPSEPDDPYIRREIQRHDPISGTRCQLIKNVGPVGGQLPDTFVGAAALATTRRTSMGLTTVGRPALPTDLVELSPGARVTSFDAVLSHDSILVAVGRADGTVAVGRLGGDDKPRPLWEERTHGAAVTAVLFRGEDCLMTGGADRSLTLTRLDEQGRPIGRRELTLRLQCTGARVEGVTGERERRLLAAAIPRAAAH